MTNEIVIITEEDIRNKIYVIRGTEVMLDSDLAKLYHCKNGTKTINQSVSRHEDRFPEDFYFELTEEETKNLWSQIGTAKNMSRTRPHVFTEQGVAMLSTVIHTSIATEVSVKIMRAFVTMRHLLLDKVEYKKDLFIIQNKILDIDNKLTLHDSKFEEIFNKFDSDDYLKNKLIIENHIYDAYSFLLDILNKTNKEIIIIDNYCDKEVLDLISGLNVKVIVISKNMNDKLIKNIKVNIIILLLNMIILFMIDLLF